MAKRPSSSRPSRDERIRGELFPDAEIFDTGTKGFVPVPIDYRRLLRHMTPPQIRVWLYLQLRSSKHGICFPTVDEIADEIGVKTSKHIRPQLRELERKGFIRSAKKSGRTYYLLQDPAAAVRRLMHLRDMSLEELREMNGLREDIGHQPIELS
ncbi:MAG: helix-turn-helix domain-containing protein [Vicinamibacterales bacterium]